MYIYIYILRSRNIIKVILCNYNNIVLIKNSKEYNSTYQYLLVPADLLIKYACCQIHRSVTHVTKRILLLACPAGTNRLVPAALRPQHAVPTSRQSICGIVYIVRKGVLILRLARVRNTDDYFERQTLFATKICSTIVVLTTCSTRQSCR